MNLRHEYTESRERKCRVILFTLDVSEEEAGLITRFGLWTKLVQNGTIRIHAAGNSSSIGLKGFRDRDGNLIRGDITLRDLADGPITLDVNSDRPKASASEAEHLRERVEEVALVLDPCAKKPLSARSDLPQPPPLPAEFLPPRSNLALERSPVSDLCARCSFSLAWFTVVLFLALRDYHTKPPWLPFIGIPMAWIGLSLARPGPTWLLIETLLWMVVGVILSFALPASIPVFLGIAGGFLLRKLLTQSAGMGASYNDHVAGAAVIKALFGLAGGGLFVYAYWLVFLQRSALPLWPFLLLAVGSSGIMCVCIFKRSLKTARKI